jgi:plastocyanin
MRWSGFAAVIAACVLTIAACGSSATPAGSASSASPGAGNGSPAGSAGGACPVATDGTAVATVSIRDFAFDPPSVTVKAGEAVAWTNFDAATHDVATLDGSCDTGRITRGSTIALVFPTAGTYTYHCTIHASMPEATVVVTP